MKPKDKLGEIRPSLDKSFFPSQKLCPESCNNTEIPPERKSPICNVLRIAKKITEKDELELIY